MKIVSWNVNGIRAAWNHGLSAFLKTCEADVYAFQETRTGEVFPLAELDGYFSYWSFCTTRKGYSGTMCITRQKPLQVSYDMNSRGFDTEGRIITLEYEDFFLVNCYVPNSQGSESRYDYRSEWDIRLIQYLNHLRVRKPTVVCGDFNATVADDDIYTENRHVELNATGFLSTERESLLEMVNFGFTDTYRLLHPDENKYTWWSNRRFKRQENRGWRLDYFFVSEDLRDKVTEADMMTDVQGSDHCPVVLGLDMAWSESDGAETVAAPPASYTYRELAAMDLDEYTVRRILRTDLTALWNSIDWAQAEQHLSDMQMAVAKSSCSRNPDLISKWQKRITNSLDAKLLAVRHTCSTSGGAGVDGIVWLTEHDKMAAALTLTSKDYFTMPARLLLIRSKNGKQRRIHVETYYDRAMQCLYAYALDPVAESWGDRQSFAYRRGRSAYDASAFIREGLSGKDAPRWVFIADVRKCYENISHEWIIENIPLPEFILKQFIRAGYVFGGELFPMDVGIGIGCSISPIIANMALDGLQDYIYSHLYPYGEIDYANGNMVRYADDLIFMARSRETARRIQEYTEAFLEERGLMLAPEKSRIVHMDEGFTFMSRTYFLHGTKCFARPSDAAVERFMGSLKDTIENYTGSQKSLIEKLNHQIDGWTAYHRVSEADDSFRLVDVYICGMLLRLCESKHPKWDKEKILRKYWYMDGKGRYCYALPDRKEVRVKSLADTLPMNFQPLHTRMNPYINRDYFERRNKESKIRNVTGIYRSVWNRQDGRCYYCGHPIKPDEEKAFLEVEPSLRRFTQRMAYVHTRCLYGSFDYVDAVSLPTSLSDVMKLLEQLETGSRKTTAQKYMALSEFFRTCDKPSVTLTFKELEEIMGDTLGVTSRHPEFWYRTGFGCISQCWLDNGYEIKTLHLEGKQRAVFILTDKSKRTASVVIPETIKYGRVPASAKYELENHFKYIVQKYGL